MLYAFFWVITRRLEFKCRCFGTLCLSEDGTECSETSAFTLQTPGNYPKESIQHTEHGESLKSRILRHVSMYLHHLQGVFSYVCETNKINNIKIIT